MSYKINPACKRCGICKQTCKVGAITKGWKQYTINQPKCIGCGNCAVECPFDAITLANDSLPDGIVKKRETKQHDITRALLYEAAMKRRRKFWTFLLLLLPAGLIWVLAAKI